LPSSSKLQMEKKYSKGKKKKRKRNGSVRLVKGGRREESISSAEGKKLATCRGERG